MNILEFIGRYLSVYACGVLVVAIPSLPLLWKHRSRNKRTLRVSITAVAAFAVWIALFAVFPAGLVSHKSYANPFYEAMLLGVLSGTIHVVLLLGPAVTSGKESHSRVAVLVVSAVLAVCTFCCCPNLAQQ